MELTHILLAFLSLTELALLSLVAAFFARLKKSETLVQALQARQGELVNKLRVNAQLEQELVQSFSSRQEELTRLDRLLEDRTRQLRGLVKQAENYTRSPQFLRQVILTGHGEGRPTQALARDTGLTVDEVELILSQGGTN